MSISHFIGYHSFVLYKKGDVMLNIGCLQFLQGHLKNAPLLSYHYTILYLFSSYRLINARVVLLTRISLERGGPNDMRVGNPGIFGTYSN